MKANNIEMMTIGNIIDEDNEILKKMKMMKMKVKKSQ
jgi:hypothetical protein